MKVIINTDFGGFGLSKRCFELYEQRTGKSRDDEDRDENYREDPVMISIVEELGMESNGMFSSLEVVEVPDEYIYDIDEYYGLEHIVLKIREDYLRNLIRLDNEDDIINYVKKTQVDYCYEEEYPNE